jgi:hypothetical protein
MTNIVEHKIVRFTWELVRHTYLVDLESEIEIRQVGISPSHENRLLDPPYPFTPFFEIEIDQIQKNGKTVFSFRNICPVQINQKPAWNILNSLTTTGSSRVTKRFQSQDGETETRWLYTDDFFLISLSSGDRHDLSMLLSLILGKLNMIALSIQSGRRIRSEFENQQKYRAAMSTMFSEGVDGAFRDVPVYQQHGGMTDNLIDVSAALRSSEFHDLNNFVASEDSAPVMNPVGQTRSGPAPSGDTPAVSTLAQDPVVEITETSSPSGEIIPEVTTPGTLQDQSALTEELPVPETGAVTEEIPEDRMQEVPVLETGAVTEEIPEDRMQEVPVPETGAVTEEIPEDRMQEVPVPETGAVTEEIPEDRMQEVPVPETGAVTDELPKSEGRPEIIPETVALPAGISGDNPEAEPVPEENAPVPFFPASRLCRGCGAQISGTAKFCNSCGTETSSAPMAESIPAGKSCGSCGAQISSMTKFCGSCGTAVNAVPLAERALPEKSCSSCGFGISSTTKFCGSCGAAVSPAPPTECAPVSPRITANTGDDTSPTGSESAAGQVVILKTIEELKDLSWLTD